MGINDDNMPKDDFVFNLRASHQIYYAKYFQQVYNGKFVLSNFYFQGSVYQFMKAVDEIFADDSVNLSLFGHNKGKQILKSLLTKSSVKNVSKLYLTDIDLNR